MADKPHYVVEHAANGFIVSSGSEFNRGFHSAERHVALNPMALACLIYKLVDGPGELAELNKPSDQPSDGQSGTPSTPDGLNMSNSAVSTPGAVVSGYDRLEAADKFMGVSVETISRLQQALVGKTDTESSKLRHMLGEMLQNAGYYSRPG